MIENNEEIPKDLEAEQSVLGCMIFDIEGISIAYDVLISDDFYSLEHKQIFEAIIDMYSTGENVDIITLKNKLESKKCLEKVGGYDYLVKLYNIVSTSAFTKQYADIVKEKSQRRKLIKVAKTIKEVSCDNSKDINTIISNCEKTIMDLSVNNKTTEFYHILEVLTISLDNIEKLTKNDNRITGIETGFIDFDNNISGLQNSDFILIAGRPSMGKTAFALNIAQYVSIKKNITTAIFSLEMSKEQLVNRMICSEACIETQKFRNGDIKDEWYKIIEAVNILSEAPIYIDDNTSISIPELKSKCRKLKKEKNLGLVVIDYLQLMNGYGKNENRQQEISSISRALKGLARELNIPIIALSQLSRSVEQRKPPKPMLSDLRESGAIEQDADLVCFLYREEYYIPDTDKKGEAELIIAKHRNGSTGTINLRWLAEYTKFFNLELGKSK